MSQPLRPSPPNSPWKTFGIVVITLVAVFVVGWVLTFLGS